LGANGDAIHMDGRRFGLRRTHPATVVTSPPCPQGLSDYGARNSRGGGLVSAHAAIAQTVQLGSVVAACSACC
jgi:hypothetical protein